MTRLEFERDLMLLCEKAEGTLPEKQVADTLISALATYANTRKLNLKVVSKTLSCYHRIVAEAPMA
jgi:hypothetical protein